MQGAGLSGGPPADLVGACLCKVPQGGWSEFGAAPAGRRARDPALAAHGTRPLLPAKAQAFHALTDGRIKYVRPPLNDGSEQLFELDKDSREERNLAQDVSQRPLLEDVACPAGPGLAKHTKGFSDGKRLIAGRPYRSLMRP